MLEPAGLSDAVGLNLLVVVDVDFADVLEVMFAEVVPDSDAVLVSDVVKDEVGTVGSGIVPTTK